MVKKYPEYDITNYDKLTYAGSLENVSDIEGWYHNYHFVKGDICDYEKLKKTVKALDIDVKFLRPCAPGPLKTVANITKEGRSICFTEAALYQNDKLIATSSATNKMVESPF